MEKIFNRIAKYAPLSIATIQGHRHAHRSNIQSTKSTKTGPLPLTYTATTANTEEICLDPINIRTNNIFIDNIEVTGHTFSDQIGRFVCPSFTTTTATPFMQSPLQHAKKNTSLQPSKK